MRNQLKGFWFISPNRREVKNVPKKNKAIIFLDDLNKFADDKFELSDFLRNFKEKIVIATCRSGASHKLGSKKSHFGICKTNFLKNFQ